MPLCDLRDHLHPDEFCSLEFDHSGSCISISTCILNEDCLQKRGHPGPCEIAAAFHARHRDATVLSFPNSQAARKALDRVLLIRAIQVLESYGEPGAEGIRLLQRSLARLTCGFSAMNDQHVLIPRADPYAFDDEDDQTVVYDPGELAVSI